jgi:hypothetical protein
MRIVHRHIGLILLSNGYTWHYWRYNSSLHWVTDPKANEQPIRSLYGKHNISFFPQSRNFSQYLTSRVYAILALYLLLCSFWLTIKAFIVCWYQCILAHAHGGLGDSGYAEKFVGRPSYNHVLEAPCWFSNCSNGVNFWYVQSLHHIIGVTDEIARHLFYRVIPLRECYFKSCSSSIKRHF